MPEPGSGEIQRTFDIVQGKYGRDGFSGKRSPAYAYLCSLVANYPDQALSDPDREQIKKYSAVDSFLLYEI